LFNQKITIFIKKNARFIVLQIIKEKCQNLRYKRDIVHEVKASSTINN